MLEGKLQKTTVLAGLIATMCVTALLTVPGGFYEDTVYGKTCATTHSAGEARINDRDEFKVFIYGALLSLYANVAAMLVYGFAGGADILRYDKALFLIRSIVVLTSLASLAALHCLVIIILGKHTFIADHLSLLAIWFVVATGAAVAYVWYW
ncbi:hypothetical protein L2E82_52358 [Cichorium intybus]|nr:hypothetical protein L2E82_52358 [Cichorium intybus]